MSLKKDQKKFERIEQHTYLVDIRTRVHLDIVRPDREARLEAVVTFAPVAAAVRFVAYVLTIRIT